MTKIKSNFKKGKTYIVRYILLLELFFYEYISELIQILYSRCDCRLHSKHLLS